MRLFFKHGWLFCWFCCSCTTKLLITYPLVVDGDASKEVTLYRIPNPHEPDPDTFVSISRFRMGVEQNLEPGNYFLANECSGFAFEHKKDSPKKIIMSKVVLDRKLRPNDVIDASESLLLECNDPIDGRINRWTDISDFPVFPGETSFLLAKKSYTVKSSKETVQTHVIPLAPVLLSGGPDAPKDKFFIFPSEQTSAPESFVISANAGKRVWLPPGIFTLEINGSRRKVEVQAGMVHEIFAGQLRINMPSAFSPEARLQAGGQPVFAYIAEGVLLNLNTDYLILPGEYTVSIEGSEIKKTVMVEPHKKTVLTTRTAQIDSPACPPDITYCKNPSKITIHREQRPYALMYVDPGVPFLVFDDAYEYGVDGSRGIFKKLLAETDTLKRETTARVKIQWEIRHAAGKVRTDLVRLETSSGDAFGRTLDLLFSKPDEIYVPPGQYVLSYFVGDPAMERVKTKIEVALPPGGTKTIVVPLYTDRAVKTKEQTEATNTANKSSTGVELPTSLRSIHK